MDKLLTKNDLAEHWKVTPKSIENWIKEGKLTPCENVPGDIRFTLEYIQSMEGVKLDPLSPLERRRLEKELTDIKKERDTLKSVIAELNMIMTKAMFKLTNKQED